MTLIPEKLFTTFDPSTGTIHGYPTVTRRLSDLRGLFLDGAAFEAAVSAGDPVVYTVATIDFAHGEGQLHCGLGVLNPGSVGREYYFTKGHMHSWKEAAEYYIGLKGRGLMILEEEQTGISAVVDLLPNSTVYVPGRTAHRTVNTGDVPLVYIGVYPSGAGHDYTTIAERNFSTIVVAHNGTPRVMSRADASRK